MEVLEQPICMLGGWAVFFHVNKAYQEENNIPYLGSRDIDLGFHFEENPTDHELINSEFAKATRILEKDLGFEPISFRLRKDLHSETGKEIKENEHVPAHFRFNMFIDPIIDRIPKNFTKILKFHPIDEPLLQFAFEQEKYRSNKQTLHKKLLLPSVSLMVAMKIKALPNRGKQHKRVKDICDLFALIWYGEETTKSIKEQITNLVTIKDITKAIECLEKDSLEAASSALNHTINEIDTTIRNLGN